MTDEKTPTTKHQAPEKQMKKFQTPSTKHQRNSKIQIPFGAQSPVTMWSLGFDVSLELGAWNLVLRIYRFL